MPLDTSSTPKDISTIDSNGVTDSENESSQSENISSRSNVLNSLKRKSPPSITETTSSSKKSIRLNQKNGTAYSLELDVNGDNDSGSENDLSRHHKDPESDNERLTANSIQPSTMISRVKKQPRLPYRAPDGFEIALCRHRNSASFNIRGKKLWHIIAPRSFSLSAISEFNVGRRSQVNIMTSDGGIHHDLEPSISTDVNIHVLLLPDESGQTYNSTVSPFDNTFYIHRPRFDSEQFPETSRLSLRPVSPSLTPKAIRKQQEGLKPRHWATGFEETPSLT